MNTAKRRGPAPRSTATLLIAAVLLTAAIGCAPHRGTWMPDRDPAASIRQAKLQAWRTGPRLLRVGLASGEDSVAVTLTAPAELHWLPAGRSPAGHGMRAEPGVWRLTPADDTGTVTAWSPDGRGWRVELPEHGLLVRPADPDGACEVDGTPYAGDLLATVRDGRLTLVNVVELETYLRGVVPWEIGRPGEAGLAALEAQAVAARTYTVSHLGARHDEGCDVWADTRDQVYRGLHGTDPWCDRAIANTAGLVLRHRGREIEAYYSSTCGGTTSAIEAVWPRPAQDYLRTHDDRGRDGRAYCADSSQFTWEETWSAAALTRILAASLPAYRAWVEASPLRQAWAGEFFRPARAGADPDAPGALLDLRILDRTPSGRVRTLLVRTEAGEYRVRGDRTRWVLAPDGGRFGILRSAWFDVELRRDREGRPAEVAAAGRGFGHGIGLCQTGALGMARLGADSARILAHYYPGASLETAW
ncbi:MAG TPA: SpoIID/LytB domain-containing protein [Candidatus Krumholzibacteria bacterium]|nr:SpoIID/LytB domain-containing protein [Candidatus Krumholzibacteria bacterium]HRX50234.1 SpoIID/LytB domain-containing protein [Candidatus Krumholzibacteria bacterium]